MVWCFLRGVACAEAGGARGWGRARCAVPCKLWSLLWSWWVAVVWWLVCAVPFSLEGGCFGSAYGFGAGLRSWCLDTGWAVRELASVAWRVYGCGRRGAAGVPWWLAVGSSCGGSLPGGVGAVVGLAVVNHWSGWWLVFSGHQLVVFCVGALLSRGFCE